MQRLQAGTRSTRRAQGKTDVASNSLSPKFLKDLRFGVADPASDTLTVRCPLGHCRETARVAWFGKAQGRVHRLASSFLQVELMQQGQRGDLVIGKELLRISSIVDKGTLVTWLPLTSVDGDCAAELCLVMRYLQGEARARGEFVCHRAWGIAGCRLQASAWCLSALCFVANRPLTPSYAITAREERERAANNGAGQPDLNPGEGRGAGSKVSKALFTDLSQPGWDSAARPTVSATVSVLAPTTPPKGVEQAAAGTPATASRMKNVSNNSATSAHQQPQQLQQQQQQQERTAAVHQQQRHHHHTAGGGRRGRGLGLGLPWLVRALVGKARGLCVPHNSAWLVGGITALVYLTRLRSPHEVRAQRATGDAQCALSIHGRPPRTEPAAHSMLRRRSWTCPARWACASGRMPLSGTVSGTARASEGRNRAQTCILWRRVGVDCRTP